MSRKLYSQTENSLGYRLRLYREKNGFNAVEFSQLLNISQGSLSNIENNRQEPSSKPINNLIKNTNINIHWLYSGEGNMIRGPEKEGDVYADVDPQIVELLGMTKKVLESQTSSAASLSVNIRSFFESVEIKKQLSRMEEDISTIKKKVDKASQVEEHIGEREEASAPEKDKTPQKIP